MLKTIAAAFVLSVSPVTFISIAFAQQSETVDCVNIVSIPEIQGASHRSTYVDQVVETCGVVTAVAFSGYYLQDPTGDGDTATSDGIFVAQREDQPVVGTELRVAATVAESIAGGANSGNLSVTQLIEPSVISSGSAASQPIAVILGVTGRQPPATIVISDDETNPSINLQNALDAAANLFDPESDAIDFYESIEGMLVTVPEPVAISAVRQFGGFSAEVFVLADRGAGAEPADARTSRGALLLQAEPDNRGDQNPERIQLQFDGTLFGSTDYPAIAVGATLDTVTGVLGYSFGNYEVQVLGGVEFESGGNLDEVTTLSSSSSGLRVATYNVLNLSALSDDDDQRSAIAQHIVRNMDTPEIIALQEVQDNNGDIGDCPRDEPESCANALDASQTLQFLVDAITAAGSPVLYQYFTVDPLVETTDDSRDNPDTFGGASLGNIRNAFLYNPERVDLVEFQGLTRDILAARGVSEPNVFDTSRDPLEATFVFNGQEVTIINNHFSSRFGSSPIYGGPQPFIQAAEDVRESQALAMHEVTQWWLDNDADAKVIILGDLNTFEFTNDLTDILPAASGNTLLSRVTSATVDLDPYTFIFEGNAQSLDHVFATQSLLDRAEIDVVHVNVDSPRLFDSVVGSDHEPVLAKFIVLENDVPLPELALRAEVYSSTAIELFWRRDLRALVYQVSRDGDVLENLDGLSYFDSSLQPDTTYRYDLASVDDQGSLLVDTLMVTTRNDDGSSNERPEAVTNLSALVYSSTAVELFWNAAGGTVPILGYDISRNGESVVVTEGRSFFEQELAPNTDYVYTIKTIDVNSLESVPTSITVRTNDDVTGGFVSAVGNLLGQVYSSTALEIFWEPAQGGDPVIGYQIFRNGEQLNVLDAKSFFDSGLTPGTEYRYSVVPVNSTGKVGSAAEVVLVTAAM